jgi:hypothetical protein
MPPGVADDPDGVGGGAPAAQLPPTPVGALAALGAGGQQVSGGAAHSASTSGGSAGSPSSRSEQHAPDGAAKGAAPGAAAAAAAAASTPASESTFLRLNNLDINGDDAPSSQAPTRLVCPNGLCCQLRHPAAAAAAAVCVTLCSVINLWRSGIVIMTKCPMLVRRAVFARYSNYYVEVSLLRG